MIEKISILADRHGLTQGDVEEKARLSANRISKWRGGTGEPTALQALNLARLFKVPVEWLIDPETSPDPPTPDEDEAYVLRTFRALRGEGLTAEVAVLRMTAAVVPLPHDAADSFIGPEIDLTESTERRQREASKPRKPAPAPKTPAAKHGK